MSGGPTLSHWQAQSGLVGGVDRAYMENPAGLEVRKVAEDRVLELSVDAPRTLRVLDIGCNTGVFGYRLALRGWKGTYVGLDSNWKAVAKAAELSWTAGYRSAFVCDDACDPLTTLGSFFVVHMKDVVEHQVDWEPMFDSVYRNWNPVHFIVTFFVCPKYGAEEFRYNTQDGYWVNRYDLNKILLHATSRGRNGVILYRNDEHDTMVLHIEKSGV